MASGDVFKIELNMVYANQQCRPGFYLVEGAGGGVGPPCTVVAQHVVNALGAVALNGFSSLCVLTGVRAADVQPATAASEFVATTGVVAGDQADDNPPAPQNSMLIQWHTAKKGGKGVFAARGRSYIPGIYSTGQISGFLITALQDALSGFASKLAAEYITDGTAYQMHCVAFNPGSPRTVSIIEPVVGFSLDNQVDIVRRRRPGRGI